MADGKALRLPGVVPFSSHFMMVFCGHSNNAGKKDDIHPAESAESKVAGGQCSGGHQKDTDPDAEKPDQADVIGRFPLEDPHDERDIKKGKDRSRPHADLKKDFHFDGF